MYQNGGWPVPETQLDEEGLASDRFNRKALFELLQSLDEKVIEIYVVWAGNYAREPKIREEIRLERILDPDFYFKEQGFLTVNL
jgi:hypothetical protein